MMPLLEIYWPYLLAALFIGLALAWLLFAANRKTRVTSDKRDVLDEGAAPAARNQALIDDAPAVKRDDTPAAAAPPPPQDGDDLTRIKGVGAKLVTLLASHGVVRFEQIAAWDDAEIDRIDAQLGRFEGRIRRDNWTEQAKLLASGDTQAFDEKFGNS